MKMWSNLNDSFSAISGHITNLRQSIPPLPFVETEADKLVELETKCSLLSEEVGRFQEIAWLYKNRWLQAEELYKQHTGFNTQIYREAGQRDESDLLPQKDETITTTGSVGENEHQVEDDFSTIPLSSSPSLPAIHQTSITTSVASNAPVKCSIDKLRFDSATKRIMELEEDRKNIEADREHWRALAKKKTKVEEELELANRKLEVYSEQVDKLESQCAQLTSQRNELATELQELDAQHERALAKVIEKREELQSLNVALQTQVDVLKYRLEELQSKKSDELIQSTSRLEAETQTNNDEDVQNVQQQRLHETKETEAELEAQDQFASIVAEQRQAMPSLGVAEADSTRLEPEGATVEENDRSQVKVSEDCRIYDQSFVEQLEKAHAMVTQRLEQTEAEVRMARQEHDHWAQDKAVLEEKLARLQTELAQAKDLLKHAELEVQDLKEEHSQLICNLSDVQHERDCLQLELDQLRSHSMLMNDETSQSATKAQEELLVAAESLQRFEQTLHEKEELIVELRRDLQELEIKHREEIEQLNEQRKQLEVELEKSLAQVALIQETEHKTSRDEEEITGLKEKIAMLEADQDRRRKEAEVQMEEVKREAETKIERLSNEMGRLRQHLVTVEENYTSELMEEQTRHEQTLAKLSELQAQQHVVNEEHEQVLTLITQRDKALHEVSRLEDKVQQHNTSIANLQAVIEQLEKDHQRKLRAAEQQAQHRLDQEKLAANKLETQLRTVEARLKESLEALEAASRLSETIDQKEVNITHLKKEVKIREATIESLRRQIDSFNESQEGKVDKQITKNLLISYFATPTNRRQEGERLLARFLDFNQEEMERAGIRIGGRRQQQASPGGGNAANESFSSMFVEFLEHESSKPDGGGSAAGPSTHSSQTIQLARDLNRRLSSSSNPYVPNVSGSFAAGISASTRPSGLGHSRSSSSSSISMADNPLFLGTMAAAVNVLAPAGGDSGQHSASISDVVRKAVEKVDIV